MEIGCGWNQILITICVLRNFNNHLTIMNIYNEYDDGEDDGDIPTPFKPQRYNDWDDESDE